MNRARAVELGAQLSQFKRLATGAPAVDFPSVPVSDAARFPGVAISVGEWYLTQLNADMNVIRARATSQERSTLTRFYRLLKDQRNYSAHPADYERAVEAEAWRRGVQREQPGQSSDGQLIDALLDELCTALECVCAIAARIVRSPPDSQSWRQAAASSPEEEMQAAYANIGRYLPPNRLTYAVIQFNKHPELRKAKTIADRGNIAELVALGILVAPLRVPYDELLDEFGLIGDARASALLLLAHGLQAAGIPQSRFPAALTEIWEAVQRAG